MSLDAVTRPQKLPLQPTFSCCQGMWCWCLFVRPVVTTLTLCQVMASNASPRKAGGPVAVVETVLHVPLAFGPAPEDQTNPWRPRNHGRTPGPSRASQHYSTVVGAGSGGVCRDASCRWASVASVATGPGICVVPVALCCVASSVHTSCPCGADNFVCHM